MVRQGEDKELAERRRRRNRQFLSIAIIFVACFSTLFIALPMFFYIKNKQISNRWITIQGRVTEASISQSMLRAPSGFQQRWVYSPDIKYSYYVHGFEHFGYRYQIQNWSSGNRQEVEKVVSQYTIGQSCTIHYDPNDPASSVLNVSMPQWEYYIFLIGLLGFASIPLMTRQRRRLTIKANLLIV